MNVPHTRGLSDFSWTRAYLNLAVGARAYAPAPGRRKGTRHANAPSDPITRGLEDARRGQRADPGFEKHLSGLASHHNLGRRRSRSDRPTNTHHDRDHRPGAKPGGGGASRTLPHRAGQRIAQQLRVLQRGVPVRASARGIPNRGTRSFSPPSISVQSISGHPIDPIQLGRRGPSGAFVTRGFDSRSGRGSLSPKLLAAVSPRPPPTAHLTLPPPDQSTHTRPTNTSWPRATTDTTRPTARTTH